MSQGHSVHWKTDLFTKHASILNDLVHMVHLYMPRVCGLVWLQDKGFVPINLGKTKEMFRYILACLLSRF